MNRRQFLKTATDAVMGAMSFPYIVASSALGKAGSVAPSNRIVTGCIGVGTQGTGVMRGFLGRDDVQMVAICDVDIKHRNNARDIVNEKYGNRDCATYNDFRELLARDDIDAVSLALPDHWHAIPAIMAARTGKDMYSEKPMAYSIAEGRAICDAVKRYGVVWQTGSWQRSVQNFRFACELVRNGRIGKVHTVKVGLFYSLGRSSATKPALVPDGFDYDMWLGPAPWAPYCPDRCHRNFRRIRDYSWGSISDWAGHHCDIAQWGMETDYTAPVEIEGSGFNPRPEHDVYDTIESYRFECKYAEGFTMIVADSKKIPIGVRFEGTDGWIHVSRSGDFSQAYKSPLLTSRAGLHAHPESILKSVIGPNEIHLYESKDHVGNFIDCIKTRARTVAPAEVAHYSMMIGHLGRIAMELGRKLKWDVKKERFINDPEADRLLSRPMRSPWHL